jgi:hypothetical protein
MSGSRAKVSISARRTENNDSEQMRHHAVNCRRSSVSASLVRPRYPARNPASASRSDSVNADWIVTTAAEGVVGSSGTFRGG